MANKLTRIEIDSGIKDFIPKTGFTGDDLKQIGKKSKLKPSITIRRQKLKDNFVPGTPSREVESEFGIKIGKDQQGVFFRKTFKKGGLKEWFRQNWVDIGSKRKDGSYAKCGRSKLAADRKRKYPKCVPAAKAARMTDSQKRSAVARKRARAQGVGGKPTNVKTFAKK